jgi:hypothetical protein
MRHLCIIILCLAAAPAWAGWTHVAEGPGTRTYADPATLKRSGDVAAMWSVRDYQDFQRMVEVGYFSHKTLAEYDCRQKRSRGLSTSLHEGHMGEGKAIYADETAHDWEEVVPETEGEALWKAACR